MLKLAPWERLNLEAAHFVIESELLTRFVAAGEVVEFVPIQVLYRHEQSKIRPGLDAWRWLRWWWQARRRPKAEAPVFARPISLEG
jgi:hypothetical protein